MSMADTADYQLAQLADVMTNALKDAEAAGWRNEDFRDGFNDALDIIADGMGIEISKTFKWR